MKRWVIGDVHGGYKALLQAIKRSGADIHNDEFIFLGDICDGWSQVKECVEFIQNLPKYVLILGNHDKWALDWGQTGYAPRIWTSQGGEATMKSFDNDPSKFPTKFFREAMIWHLDDSNNLFIHGGIPKDRKLEDITVDEATWDRSMVERGWHKVLFATRGKAESKPFPRFKRIFVGHTTTTLLPPDNAMKPVFYTNLVCCDTGGGWEGKITIMNVDTLEYFQSERVSEFYPEEKGRK